MLMCYNSLLLLLPSLRWAKREPPVKAARKQRRVEGVQGRTTLQLEVPQKSIGTIQGFSSRIDSSLSMLHIETLQDTRLSSSRPLLRLADLYRRI